MTDWRKETSIAKPAEIQEVGPGVLIERRNIEQKTQQPAEGTEDEAYTYYEAESRTLTVSEYNMLQSITEIDNTKAIDAYTMQLFEEGVI